jgi:hypothetical protein
MRTSGTLCGTAVSLLKTLRLPRTSARARAAAPALMCTAVPPAKSIVSVLRPRWVPSWPTQPVKVVVSPSTTNENTHEATGK